MDGGACRTGRAPGRRRSVPLKKRDRRFSAVLQKSAGLCCVQDPPAPVKGTAGKSFGCRRGKGKRRGKEETGGPGIREKRGRAARVLQSARLSAAGCRRRLGQRPPPIFERPAAPRFGKDPHGPPVPPAARFCRRPASGLRRKSVEDRFDRKQLLFAALFQRVGPARRHGQGFGWAFLNGLTR